MPSTDYPCNNLDPGQARHEVVSDLDSNCMTLWWHSLNDFSKKKNEKFLKDDKKASTISKKEKSSLI